MNGPVSFLKANIDDVSSYLQTSLKIISYCFRNINVQYPFSSVYIPLDLFVKFVAGLYSLDRATKIVKVRKFGFSIDFVNLHSGSVSFPILMSKERLAIQRFKHVFFRNDNYQECEMFIGLLRILELENNCYEAMATQNEVSSISLQLFHSIRELLCVKVEGNKPQQYISFSQFVKVMKSRFSRRMFLGPLFTLIVDKQESFVMLIEILKNSNLSLEHRGVVYSYDPRHTRLVISDDSALYRVAKYSSLQLYFQKFIVNKCSIFLIVGNNELLKIHEIDEEISDSLTNDIPPELNSEFLGLVRVS